MRPDDVAARVALLNALLLSGCGSVAGEQALDGGARDARIADAPHDADARRADGGCDSGQPGVRCLAVADPTHENGAITVDDANVYWAASGQTAADDVIMRVSRAGGDPVTLAQGSANSLASDGVNLYWADWYVDASPSTGSIRRVPVNGGAVTTVAMANSPNCMTLDAAHVYWSEVWSGNLDTVAKEGGAPVTLAHAMTGIVATPILVSATNVYWAPLSLLSVNADGGSVTPVWVDSPASLIVGSGCRSLAIGGTRLILSYALGTEGTAIGTFPLAGAASPTVIVSSGNPSAVVASSTEAFWVGNTDTNSIAETSLEGGVTVTLAMPLDPQIEDMVLASDGTLYWTGDFQVQSLKP